MQQIVTTPRSSTTHCLSKVEPFLLHMNQAPIRTSSNQAAVSVSSVCTLKGELAEKRSSPSNSMPATYLAALHHKYSMMEQLGLTRTTELVRYATQTGLCRDESCYVTRSHTTAPHLLIAPPITSHRQYVTRFLARRRFDYSNLGHKILDEVVARVSGMRSSLKPQNYRRAGPRWKPAEKRQIVEAITQKITVTKDEVAIQLFYISLWERSGKWLAEGEGFEPPVGLPLRLISSQVPSTTQPPFRCERS